MAACQRCNIRAKLLDLSANRTVTGNSKTAYRVQKPGGTGNLPKTMGNANEEKDCTWCRKRKMRSQGHTWNECRKLKAHNAKQKEEKGKEEKAQQVSQTKPEEPSTYATAFQTTSSHSGHALVQPSLPMAVSVTLPESAIFDLESPTFRRSGICHPSRRYFR